MERFRGGLVFKAHRLLYHSTPGSRVIKKKKKDRVAHFVHDHLLGVEFMVQGEIYIAISMSISIYISIYLPVYLPVYIYLSVYICLSTCLHLSICLYLSTFISICLSIYLSAYLPTYLYLSIYRVAHFGRHHLFGGRGLTFFSSSVLLLSLGLSDKIVYEP